MAEPPEDLSAEQLDAVLDALQKRGTIAAGPASAAAGGGTAVPLDLSGVEVELSVYVGGGFYQLSELAGVSAGSVLPLSTAVGEPAVIAIHGRVVALGEVVVMADDTLGVRITELARPGQALQGRLPSWLR